MKRPLAVIGFSYTAALWAAFLFDPALLLYLSAGLAAAGIIMLAFRRLRKKPFISAILLSAAAALVSFSLFTSAYVQPLDALYGQRTIVSGRICEMPYEQNGRVYYKIETDSTGIPGAPEHTTMLLSSSRALKADVYDRITASVRLWKESDERYRGYNISRRIFLRGSIDTYSEIKTEKRDDKPPYYYAVMARGAVMNAVRDTLPERESSFICALLTGERSGLRESDKEMFRACGISHITVVSGFHLSVMVQLFFMVISIFVKNRRVASVPAAAFVFVCMAAAGFTPSVMRAGVMQILMLLSAAVFSKADPLNSLGLAALIICFINPYTAADAGFLLSMSSTLGIILLSNRIHRIVMKRVRRTGKKCKASRASAPGKLYRAFDGVISAISVSLSAWLFSLPVSILFFQSFSVYSVFFNLLVTFPVSLLMIVSVCMVIFRLSWIFSFAALPFALLSGLLCRLVYFIAGIVELLPAGIINAAYDFVPACMILCGGILIILLLLKDRKTALRVGAWITVMVFFAASLLSAFLRMDSAKVTLIDTGSGICVLVDDGVNNSLIGCGADSAHKNSVTDYLERSSAGDISFLMIPDRSDESSGAAAIVLEKYHIRAAYVCDEEKQYERVHRLLGKADELITASSGDAVPGVIHNGNTDYHVIASKDCTAVFFRLYRRSFLVCFSKTDCALIPDEWKNTDYLIVNGQIKNPQEITADKVMISDDGSMIPADAAALSGVSDEIYYTGGRGHLFVRLYPQDESDIGRETLWLS